MTTELPLNVISVSNAEKLLGINLKQKKEKSDLLSYLRLEMEPLECFIPSERTNTVMITRQAILKAITAPHLRGVIAVLFSNEETILQIAQVKQNPLSKFELMGAFTLCYESFLSKKASKFVTSFKERKETHMIAGAGFSTFLTDEINATSNADVLVINVHHDYLEVFTNLHDPASVLEVFMQIEKIPYETFK